jgi:hypothetical protein
MSAKFQPEWVERRANIDPETGARQKRMLVIGINAAQIAGAFARLMPNCHIESATRADHAVLAMASGHFDATLVDCRGDERFHRLAVVAARQFKEGRVALLASDSFLPDEQAVLGNLDIFSSSDDSARLLASLRLETKAPEAAEPAAKNPAPQNADFESALRAELDALQNVAAPQRSGPDLHRLRGSAPAREIKYVPASSAAPMELKIAEEEARFLLLSIENAQQSAVLENFDFLADLTLELEEIQLFEPTPPVRQEEAEYLESEYARSPHGDGNLDLFGFPVSDAEEFHFCDPAPQPFADAVEISADPAGLDLFNLAAAEPVRPEAADALGNLSPIADGNAAELAVSTNSLDLFGHQISEPDENPPVNILAMPVAEAFEHAHVPGNPDLFDFISLEPRQAEPSQAIPDASREMDFFAAVRSELQAIQLSHVRTETFAAVTENAAVMPAARIAASEPALPTGQQAAAANTTRAFLPKIEELAEPAAKTTLMRSTSWLAHLLPRLTPVYSLVYKNLALVILGALFTAFVAFGVMIVFFLTSNKWSAPITLSRGHEMVIKVERELSDLNVRKNQISEQIDDAKKNLKSSQDELGRVRSLSGMIEGTISAEIKNRSEIKAETENHTEALRRVAEQYGNDTLNPEFKGNLAREFDHRLINRNTFEAGKLAQLEASHRTALIRNEIAANEVEIRRLTSTLEALNALSGHVESSAAPIAGAGGADLVPLLNQVIEVRRGTSEAASGIKAAESREALLSDSLGTVEASIAQIQSTPLARAINENITVLFVPYENAGQYEKGNSLYSCAIGIFLCSEAGKVGNVIEGETVATHPFFNKPVRGSFVEADLTDQAAARKEILHVKRRPLFF